MSAQDNIALARRVYQLFNDGQFEEALSLATDDIEVELYPFGQTFRGREGFANFMKGFKTAFPDLRIQVTNQIADENQVVNEFTATGTHKGPLVTPAGDIPPTGKTVVFTVCEVWGIRNGRMSSLRNYQDSASIMRQLGLIS